LKSRSLRFARSTVRTVPLRRRSVAIVTFGRSGTTRARRTRSRAGSSSVAAIRRASEISLIVRPFLDPRTCILRSPIVSVASRGARETARSTRSANAATLRCESSTFSATSWPGPLSRPA
jgi:hypothetical protein